MIERCKIKNHCVIVIAEGAEDGLLSEEKYRIREEMGIKEDIKDESGNVKSMVSLVALNINRILGHSLRMTSTNTLKSLTE